MKIDSQIPETGGNGVQNPLANAAFPPISFGMEIPDHAGSLRDKSSPLYRLATGTGFKCGFKNFFYKPSLSASSARAMDECQLAQALRSVVSYSASRADRRAGQNENPEKLPPSVAFNASLSKRFDGVYSWMGNLLHDFFEDLKKLRVKKRESLALEDVEARYTRLLHDFETQWQRSLSFNLSSFRDAMAVDAEKETRPVWLTHHALAQMRGRTLDLSLDSTDKKEKLAWLVSAADVVRDHSYELTQNALIKDWRVLEGKELLDGVPQPIPSTESEIPSFWIVIDEQPLQVFCIMDFAYIRTEEGVEQLVVTDLKTGKVKPELHRKQLEMYGIFAMEKGFGFSPEQIVLRLIYPQEPPATRVQEYEFNEQILYMARERLINDGRRILNCYLPIDDSKVTPTILKQTFSEHDARIICTIASFKRGANLSAEEINSAFRFIEEKFSPFELGLALLEHQPNIVALLEEAIAVTTGACLPLIPHNVNLALLKSVFPSLSATEILSALSTKHLRVPFPPAFGIPERVELERMTPLDTPKSKLSEHEQKVFKEFLHCISCEFSWFCGVAEDSLHNDEMRKGYSQLK